MPVPMDVFLGSDDLGVGRPKAAPSHVLERELAWQPEAGDCFLDGPPVHPGINQGGQVMSPAAPLKQSK